jgi:acetolactate decarboxylase
VKVEVQGVLHDIMHDNKTVAVAALAPPSGSHTYALGPLAGLAGEFAVVDDVVWVSKPGPEGTPRTTRGAAGEQACLVVSAQVPRWKRIALEADVPFDRFDATIRRMAERHGVDVSQPFPFLVEGTVADLAWHVIDGTKAAVAPPDHLRPPHEAHRALSPNGVLGSATAVLVGFYSTGHRGVFTHHDSDTHVHAVVDEPPLAAHVDRVRLLAGATVAFPD